MYKAVIGQWLRYQTKDYEVVGSDPVPLLTQALKLFKGYIKKKKTFMFVVSAVSICSYIGANYEKYIVPSK